MPYEIKYERLKQKVIDNINGRKSYGFIQDADFLCMLPAIEARRHPLELRDEWYDKACEVVRQWDIRRVRKLIELFPFVVPEKYRQSPIEVDDNNEKAEWIVYFA
ncbi:MAG: hypothetical protein V1799_07635 [bacterium]